MSCCCNRLDGVGGWGASLIAGLGSVTRFVAPIVLPAAVAIGTEYAIGQLVPRPTNSPAVPTPLNDPVSTAQTDRHESRISTIVGIAAVAGIAFYLLTNRRR
jgi:hypothetical protein